MALKQYDEAVQAFSASREAFYRLGALKMDDRMRALETGQRMLDETRTLTGVEGTSRGAKGVISVAANVVPEKVARLCRERATAIQEELSPLFKALFVETNPIPVKFALHRLGRARNELRLPLVPLSAEHEPTVADALRRCGAI